MPSRSLDDLTAAMKAKTVKLVSACAANGVEMRPYTTLRTPLEQAKLWRQSRSTEQIQAEILRLKTAGAPYLAKCIEKAGPQSGSPVTNALPGLSWHQWGEAVDCFWVVNGVAEWSAVKKIGGVNGYQVYAAQAKLLGLTAGGFFTSLKDWPHVQLDAAGSPLGRLSLVQIDAEMKLRFG